MLFLLILGHFQCLVVTSVTLRNNITNLKKIEVNLKSKNKVKKSKKLKIKKKYHKPPPQKKNIKKSQKSKKLKTESSKKKNLQKSENLVNIFSLPKKNVLFSQFYQLRRLVFDQSSPVHPVLNFRGGGYHKRYAWTNGQTEILVSNIGYILLIFTKRTT